MESSTYTAMCAHAAQPRSCSMSSTSFSGSSARRSKLAAVTVSSPRAAASERASNWSETPGVSAGGVSAARARRRGVLSVGGGVALSSAAVARRSASASERSRPERKSAQ